MRFASLGSGSSGNALVVDGGGTRLLIDCGFGVRETGRRLERLSLQPEDISAVLVTHEHTDHTSGVFSFARKHRLSVWLTHGTLSALGDKAPEAVALHLIDTHAAFRIGGVEITPFPVPHDAREPVQFVFGDGARRLGVVTDTGCTTTHIEATLGRCDALVLECNHDVAMLRDGPYPLALKRRVGGRLGHLSNDEAAGLLDSLDVGGLQHIVAAHLSERNNHPALARKALSRVLGCETAWVAVAEQNEGLGWRHICQ